MVIALDGLTAKQEAYCQCLFQGMTQKDAYIAAGYSIGNDPSNVYELASALANDIKVLSRLSELKSLSDAQNPLIMSVTKRKVRLSKIAERDTIILTRAGDEIVSARDSLQAVDILNKMDRIYSDTPAGGNTYNFNVIVRSPETKALIDQLMSGSRELPQLCQPSTDDTEPSST